MLTPPNLSANDPKRVYTLWAGADLNCGYGHPKAEGYQATPPARSMNQGHSRVKGSGRAGGLSVPGGVSGIDDPVFLVDRVDTSHLIVGQGKLLGLVIRFDVVAAGRFRDRGDVVL